MKYGKLTRKNIETLERLAETPEGKAALTEFVEKQKEARSAYKRYVKIINKKEKTPNEIRAAFIEKCKRYVRENGNGVEFIECEGGWFASRLLDYGISSTKGVSNEYIKKANALAWLFKDYDFVDETRNAPQPNFEVGQMISYTFFGKSLTVQLVRVEKNLLHFIDKDGDECQMGDCIITIIDDTNAIYKEGTK